jgi:hypothetical protein
MGDTANHAAGRGTHANSSFKKFVQFPARPVRENPYQTRTYCFIPRWYAAQGVQTEVVGIDPEVPRLARQYFGFPTSMPVHIEDARRFLSTTEKQYDVDGLRGSHAKSGV